ncbi:MAG: hypothetical protein HYV51_02245 [Parcubacteria group bacterium]|nr:hypothetical protein [Parcubacteria group bacterium]
MIHIGPDKLYEVLQSGIDWAVKNNYQIFFEGVKKDPPKRAATANESKIKKFFLFLFDLCPVFAAAIGISFQKEKITYPKDAINADITFAEFTRKLDKNGFRCSFLLWLFTIVPKKELEKKFKDEFVNRGGFNALMNSFDKWSLKKFVAWFLFKKAIPIILDYRNEVAVAKVKANSNGRNIFIHYGEKHVKGIVKLLRQDGWVVKETTYTDLAEFC